MVNDANRLLLIAVRYNITEDIQSQIVPTLEKQTYQ